jgi:hypothetical protein
MNAAVVPKQSPAQHCVRASGAFTGLAVGVAVMLLLPIQLLRQAQWLVLVAFAVLVVGALALAVAAAVVRGADESAGFAIVLVGFNMVLGLGVLIASFSFRMGAP